MTLNVGVLLFLWNDTVNHLCHQHVAVIIPMLYI